MNRKEVLIDFLYTHHRGKRFMTGHSMVSVTSVGGAGSQNSHGLMAEALLGGLNEWFENYYVDGNSSVVEAEEVRSGGTRRPSLISRNLGGPIGSGEEKWSRSRSTTEATALDSPPSWILVRKRCRSSWSNYQASPLHSLPAGRMWCPRTAEYQGQRRLVGQVWRKESLTLYNAAPCWAAITTWMVALSPTLTEILAGRGTWGRQKVPGYGLLVGPTIWKGGSITWLILGGTVPKPRFK